MIKNNLSHWTNLFVFGLTVFLVFFLFFESYIELPLLVAWLGRWHPLVLHFPIVFILMVALMGLLGKKVPKTLLVLASISVLITAITGFFLGTQSLPKGDLILWHQWMGSLLALLAVLWFFLSDKLNSNSIWVKGLQISLLLLVGFTGHLGGMITHGNDFLALPNTKKTELLPKNPLVYDHVVAQILEHNCVSCHNPNKKKGELLMTNLSELKIGGETGPAIVVGEPEQSEIIKRLRLPLESDEHMPPDGKKPLSEADIKIVERWIALGASDTLRLNHLNANEPLASLIKMRIQPLQDTDTWKSLPKVADSILERLSSDYLTVKRIAGNSHALSASMFMPPQYDANLILQLQRVKDNIVELDLSGLPLGNKEMEVVAHFKNLERLEIDRTTVTDVEFKYLAALTKLKHLKAYTTGITDSSLLVLKEFKDLKTLYIWDTQLSDTTLEQLQLTIPNLRIDKGLQKEIKEDFIPSDTLK